jgi:hypothetical protein
MAGSGSRLQEPSRHFDKLKAGKNAGTPNPLARRDGWNHRTTPAQKNIFHKRNHEELRVTRRNGQLFVIRVSTFLGHYGLGISHSPGASLDFGHWSFPRCPALLGFPRKK